ncbi:MAG: type II toxin-antitoxin system VapC family toxin [Cyanobacteria bacterium P01_D01_bin.105]
MFLYDTNIVSELVRIRPNDGVVAFSKNIHEIYLSTITIEEIFYGLTAKPISRTLQRIERFLAEQVVILPVTTETAKRAGELRGLLRKKGASRSQADMLIAATAQQHQLTVVTRNTKDFEGCGIPLLNPYV